MCELFAMSSLLPTTVSFSLREFARHGSVAGHNIDGWGLVYYDENDVRLFKEPEPAGDSDCMAVIERRRLRSDLVLSHIRRATQGARTLSNTQPFVRELGGRMHAFAHNGRLPGIERRYDEGPRRFRPVGQTDSETAFCVLLDRLAMLWSGATPPPIEERLAVIGRLAGDWREMGPANFLYADGDALFAHGDRRTQPDGTIAPPGLVVLRRHCAVDADALATSGLRIDGGEPGQELTLLASVPLSNEAWRPLAEGEILVVRRGRELPLG